MKIEILPDYKMLSQRAASFVARQVLAKPNSVLAFPTGKTPILMYQILVSFYRKGLLDLSLTTAFNLDEFVGLPRTHNMSYHFYLEERFIRHTNLAPERVHLLNGATTSVEDECQRYELEIQRSGGIDLAILGIGTNGHIAFNEPGTAWNAQTHTVDLAESTLLQITEICDVQQPIERGITMGIRTIMNSRRILLLASGTKKKRVLEAALTGRISSKIPASILQLHPYLTVMLDQAATTESISASA